MPKFSLEQNNTLLSLPFYKYIKDLIILFEADLLSQDEFNVELLKEKNNFEKYIKNTKSEKKDLCNKIFTDKTKDYNKKKRIFTKISLDNNKTLYIDENDNSVLIDMQPVKDGKYKSKNDIGGQHFVIENSKIKSIKGNAISKFMLGPVIYLGINVVYFFISRIFGFDYGIGTLFLYSTYLFFLWLILFIIWYIIIKILK
ncbi:MAG: hypothetical protein PF574_06290 [Candidatus Delongbacteria bacterium]|jgi:hypothetical protein|nr:hypothetical protein [Candidatus Delongbacteria bacterium]